jgi:hypothetical protein
MMMITLGFSAASETEKERRRGRERGRRRDFTEEIWMIGGGGFRIKPTGKMPLSLRRRKAGEVRSVAPDRLRGAALGAPPSVELGGEGGEDGGILCG